MKEGWIIPFQRSVILAAEDPIEAIRGNAGASEAEIAEESAEHERLDRDYEDYLKDQQAAFSQLESVVTESRRRAIARQIKAGQTKLPDIFRESVPHHVVQYIMFSDIELFRLRERLTKAPVAEPTTKTTLSGYPLYPSESMTDIINGTDFRY